MVRSATLVALLAGMAIARTADHEFEIVNSSRDTIFHLYLAPAGTGNWGQDELGEDEEDALEPGAWFKVRDVEPGIYDFRIVHADETSCIIRRVAIEVDKTVTMTNQLLETCRP
jgi:hypothetical protein